MRTLVFLLFVAGVILLQVFLSKKESKWPGLVLPILAFLFGLLYPLNMIAPSQGLNASFIFQMILVWLLGNIPMYVVLYYVKLYAKFNGKSM